MNPGIQVPLGKDRDCPVVAVDHDAPIAAGTVVDQQLSLLDQAVYLALESVGKRPDKHWIRSKVLEQNGPGQGVVPVH